VWWLYWALRPDVLLQMDIRLAVLCSGHSVARVQVPQQAPNAGPRTETLNKWAHYNHFDPITSQDSVSVTQVSQVTSNSSTLRDTSWLAKAMPHKGHLGSGQPAQVWAADQSRALLH
jgi:hypothetical protein